MTTSFYITTAIDYPLGRPHLGNAFEKIAADVQARYRRMQGYDARLLVGSDEHTVLVPREATRLGMRTADYLDERAAQMRTAWGKLDISLDDFLRTSEARHAQACRQFLQCLYDGGFVYRKNHTGRYCENCEEYKTAAQLRDGHCLNHPSVAARAVDEESSFFVLSSFRERLLDLYESRPELIQPEQVRADIVDGLRDGVADVPLTRQVEWGHRAPFDAGQRIYVWVDALLGYVTAAGYAQDEASFDRRWPADVHVVGKDIAWFHCVLWPALLLAARLELPRSIRVHGLMLHDGVKMSKTIGNVVDAVDLADRFGIDAVRFCLLRDFPLAADGNFSYDRFVAARTSQLVDILGTLYESAAALPRTATAAPEQVASLVGELQRHLERWEYDVALAKIFERVLEPALRAGDAERVEALRVGAVLLKPFMPATARRIYGTFGFEPRFERLRLEDAARPAAPTKLQRDSEPLFAR